MIDPFVLLAPVVLLLVVALLRFIGCDLVFGLTPEYPPAPTNLLTTAGDSQVTLSWAPSSGAHSYNVKRSTTSGGPTYDPYITVASAVKATGYTDSGLTDGTTYYYVVTAVGRGGGESGPSNEARATPAAVPGRPPGSMLNFGDPLVANLIGLFLMNEGSGASDKNLVDGQAANFAGTSPPTWNIADPSVVFNGGGSLNSYLDAGETGSASAFDQLPISQITVVAKLFVNAPLAPAGVCEKNDGNAVDSGFLFGWDGTGVFGLTVEKATQNMRVATAAGTIAAGQWVQVAFTWDGTVGTAAAAHLFVNGVEQAKVTAVDGSGTLGYANATNQPFRIGNASFDPIAGSLNGKMAYLAIYKGRILTTAEMNQLETKLPIT